MKKIFAVLLAVMLLLSLSACGGKEENVPAPTEAPVAAAPAEETPAPVAAEPEPTEEPAPVEEEPSLMELAESFVGGEAADMIAAVGEPVSADYAPSCLGSGEDGILEYADFLVYTYWEGGSERVDTVLAR